MCELTSEKNSVHRRLIDSVLVEDTVFSLLGMLTTLSDLPNEAEEEEEEEVVSPPVPRECLLTAEGLRSPARFGRGDGNSAAGAVSSPSRVRAPAPEGRLLSGCCVELMGLTAWDAAACVGCEARCLL
ncbi:unnamed protein product [Pleuronectes platessa]|uniref:Uncharacterized protein n=1 Tax=Pleuronectes platessa TaxID=8262 RepID=A0A9N7YN11_PLEPL|nr:unnamed protein product [Pleuronectes platessa]